MFVCVSVIFNFRRKLSLFDFFTFVECLLVLSYIWKIFNIFLLFVIFVYFVSVVCIVRLGLRNIINTSVRYIQLNVLLCICASIMDQYGIRMCGELCKQQLYDLWSSSGTTKCHTHSLPIWGIFSGGERGFELESLSFFYFSYFLAQKAQVSLAQRNHNENGTKWTT